MFHTKSKMHDGTRPMALTQKPGPVTVDRMAQYLDNPSAFNNIVRFMHPKIVQRSYGKEKRFFVPPPIVRCEGVGWQHSHMALVEALNHERRMLRDLIIESDGREDVASATHYRELLNRIPSLPFRWTCGIGINDENKPSIAELDTEYVAKGMFISNQDKRRYFRMSVELTSYLGPTTAYPLQWFGDFGSAEVRVVSKPPKRQKSRTTMSALVCLKSGMEIALYNRVAGGNVKFLYVEGDQFYASQNSWGTFNIYQVNVSEGMEMYGESFFVDDGFITYGSVVRLVDVNTGISLPNMIVRKVVKNEVQLTYSTDEPIVQMQKIAFQMCDTERSYLCLSMNQILCRELAYVNEKVHEACDAITWTVAEADSCESIFFESMGPAVNPVTPIPRITNLHLETTCYTNAILEVSGVELGKHLDIWFGLCKAEIISANRSYMRCRVPTLQNVSETPNSEGSLVVDNERNIMRVPITFARNDGVLYPTDGYFEYNTMLAGGIGAARLTLLSERQKRILANSIQEFENRMQMNVRTAHGDVSAPSSSSSRKRKFI